MSTKFKPPMGKFSKLKGKCISLVGDDIDTLQLMRYISHLFEKNFLLAV